jgi:hypothetical protein
MLVSLQKGLGVIPAEKITARCRCAFRALPRKPYTDPLRSWEKTLIEKKPFRLVAVVLANKMARIAFAILRGAAAMVGTDKSWTGDPVAERSVFEKICHACHAALP